MCSNTKLPSFFKLEDVMETETYKTAKLILERFDPDSKKKMASCLFVYYNFAQFNFVSLKIVFYSLIIFIKELESTPFGPPMTPKPEQGSNKLQGKLNYTVPHIYFLKPANLHCVLSELRHRNVVPKTPPVVLNTASGAAGLPPLASGPTYPGRSSHSAPGGPPERILSAIAAQQSLMRKPLTPGTPVPGVGELPAHRGTTS